MCVWVLKHMHLFMCVHMQACRLSQCAFVLQLRPSSKARDHSFPCSPGCTCWQRVPLSGDFASRFCLEGRWCFLLQTSAVVPRLALKCCASPTDVLHLTSPTHLRCICSPQLSEVEVDEDMASFPGSDDPGLEDVCRTVHLLWRSEWAKFLVSQPVLPEFQVQSGEHQIDTAPN